MVLRIYLVVCMCLALWGAKSVQAAPSLMGAQGIRHTAQIATLALHPTKPWVALGGAGRAITLWSIPDSSLQMTLSGPPEWVSSLSFSPAGDILASGGTDGTVQVFDVHSGALLFEDQAQETGVLKVEAFGPGKVLATYYNGLVSLFDVSKKSFQALIQPPPRGSPAYGRGAPQFSFNSARTHAAFLSPLGELTYWDLSSLKKLATVQVPGARHLASSPSGTHLAVLKGQFLKEFELPGLKEVRSHPLPTDSTVMGLQFSPAGDQLFFHLDQVRIEAYKLPEFSLLNTFENPGFYLSSPRFSPAGDYLVGGSGRNLVAWNPYSGREVYTPSGHHSELLSICFYPDQNVHTTGADGLGITWDAKSKYPSPGKVGMGVFASMDVSSFAPMNFAIAGTEEFRIQYTNLISVEGPHSGYETLPDVHGAPRSIAVAADQTMAAVGYVGGNITLLRPKSLRTKSLVGRGSGEIWTLALNPKKKILVSGTKQGNLGLWDLKTGKLRKEWKAHFGPIRNLTLSPDAKTVVSGGVDQVAFLWDTQTGQKLHTYGSQALDLSGAADFHPEGRYLALGGADGFVQVVDTESQKTIYRVKFAKGKIFPVRIEPRSQRLYAGGEDGSLWFIEPQEYLAKQTAP